MRPRREGTGNVVRWLAFAVGVLFIVVAAAMQSTLGEFSLKAAIGTYAIVIIAGFALVSILRRRRRRYPRDRHPT
jgi:lipopolysaccharide export LptBFGC system permease protein LptF